MVISRLNLDFPPPELWAALVAKNMKVTLSDAQCRKLGTAISAAYDYQKESFREAKAAAKNYNVTKHDGDWNDNQQLYYLCDPSMHLLTDDAGIKRKCASSPQCDRVLLFKEF